MTKDTEQCAVQVQRRVHNISGARQGPSLKSLTYFRDYNPLLEPGSISVKRRKVSAGVPLPTVNGDGHDAAVIHEIIEKDDSEFVKVFAEGIKAAFGLSKTASRVFMLILNQYQSEPMPKGYVDSVYIDWHDGSLSGADVVMTERTFQMGLRELLSKNFLAAKSPGFFWVNASLFFKGNRVLFVTEYVRMRTQLVEAKPRKKRLVAP